MTFYDRDRHAGVLRAMSFSGVMILLVALLAYLVMQGHTDAMDERLVRALRSAADPTEPAGPFSLQELMHDITALGSLTVLVALTISVAGYLALEGKRRTALLILIAVFGGIALAHMMKAGVGRTRPDIVAHQVNVHTTSFPSGHAARAAAAYLTIAVLLGGTARRWTTKFYLLAVGLLLSVAVGVSRLYLGVHWPTDVLAGWMTGAAWAAICWAVARLLRAPAEAR